jgi:hypothetical protein
MPNITIQVTDELYQHARVAAACRNMTVSALMRTLLTTIDQQPNTNQPDGRKFERMFSPLPYFDLAEQAERMADEHQRHTDELYDKLF